MARSRAPLGVWSLTPLDDASWSGQLADGGPEVWWRGEPLPLDLMATDTRSLREPLPPAALRQHASALLKEHPEQLQDLFRLRDPRWRRALFNEALTQGVAPAAKTATAVVGYEVPQGHRIEQLRFDDKRLLVVHSQGPFHRPTRWLDLVEAGSLQRRVHLPSADRSPVLTRPLDQVEEPQNCHASELCLFDRSANTVALYLLDAQLEPLAMWEGITATAPHSHHRCGDRGWILSEEELLELTPAPPVPLTQWQPQSVAVRSSEHPQRGVPVRVGHWLITAEPDRLSWFDLNTGSVATTATPTIRGPQALAISDDTLWILGEDGLYRAQATATPERVFDGRFQSVVANEERIWLADATGLVRLVDTSTWLEVGQTRVTGTVVAQPLAHGALFGTHDSSCWIGPDGASPMVFSAAGNLARAKAQNAEALNLGATLLISHEGRTPLRIELPYDGELHGATASHFVFGPRLQGGIPRTPPDALLAVDARGSIERLPVQAGRYLSAFTRDSFWFVDEHRIRRWTPESTPQVTLIPPPPPLRGHAERRRGHRITNPQEELPRPGLLLDGRDGVFIDGLYGGTTGHYHAPFAAPGVHLRAGAVAVLIACEIHAGGVRVEGHSTLFLVDCTLPDDSEIVVEEGSHLLCLHRDQ